MGNFCAQIGEMVRAYRECRRPIAQFPGATIFLIPIGSFVFSRVRKGAAGVWGGLIESCNDCRENQQSITGGDDAITQLIGGRSYAGA